MYKTVLYIFCIYSKQRSEAYSMRNRTGNSASGLCREHCVVHIVHFACRLKQGTLWLSRTGGFLYLGLLILLSLPEATATQ